MTSEADLPSHEESDPVNSRGLSRGIFHRLYTHNPFYLLSVCFVLHGSSYWMQKAGDYRSWPLIALVGSYILLLAIVGGVVVRLGQVWDDARSILLIILLLFVELSLTFDDPLLTAPQTGLALVLAGFLFAVVIAEGLLRGLRIRLPGLLRLPFYGLLGLMILYPLALVSHWEPLTPGQVSWRIYGFFPLAALLVLTLIPAVRRGGGYIRDSGTPWPWPWYPWTIFAVLLGGICVRGYALSLSFDPVLSVGTEAAMRLETAWGWYFLAPIALSVGWLILEFGLVLNKRRLQQAALLVPVLCVGLSVPPGHVSVPYAEFLSEFTRSIASPVFVSLIGGGVFYGIAFLKRIPLSEVGLALVLCAFAGVGPTTLGLKTLTAPNPWPLALAGGIFVLRGLIVQKSLPTLAGLLLGIAALRLLLPADWLDFWKNAASLHVLGLALLTLGAMFRDEWAKYFAFAAALLFIGGGVFAVYGTFPRPFLLPAWSIPGYVAGLIVLAFLVAFWLGSRQFFAAGVINLGVSFSVMVRDAYFVLRQLPEWPGIASFGVAFLLLAIGGGISAAKAGWLDWLKTLFHRQSIENHAES